MRCAERLNREPAPTPLRVSISFASFNDSSSRRMITGFVFTLPASNADVTGSPSLYARTANTCTAIAKRQLVLIPYPIGNPRYYICQMRFVEVHPSNGGCCE